MRGGEGVRGRELTVRARKDICQHTPGWPRAVTRSFGRFCERSMRGEVRSYSVKAVVWRHGIARTVCVRVCVCVALGAVYLDIDSSSVATLEALKHPPTNGVGGCECGWV